MYVKKLAAFVNAFSKEVGYFSAANCLEYKMKTLGSAGEFKNMFCM